MTMATPSRAQTWYYYCYYHYIFLTSKANLTCILHIGDGSSEGETKLFINNMSSWGKFLLAKENRLKALMTSNFSIVFTFSDVFESHHGYQTLCISQKLHCLFCIIKILETDISIGKISSTRSKVSKTP